MKIIFKVIKQHENHYNIKVIMMNEKVFNQYKSIPWKLGMRLTFHRIISGLEIACSIVTLYRYKAIYCHSEIGFETQKDARIFIKDFLEPNVIANKLCNKYGS